MKKKIILIVLCCLMAGVFWSIFLRFKANELCDQIREIRKNERESISSIIPPKWLEKNLIRLAKDTQNRRSRYALNMLGGMKSTQGRRIMEKIYLVSDDPSMRTAAIDSLSYYSDEKMYQSIFSLMRYESNFFVFSLAGVSLVKSIHLVDEEDLKELMINAKVYKQKCVFAGILHIKNPSEKTLDQYMHFKSKLSEESVIKLKSFEDDPPVKGQLNGGYFSQ